MRVSESELSEMGGVLMYLRLTSEQKLPETVQGPRETMRSLPKTRIRPEVEKKQRAARIADSYFLCCEYGQRDHGFF